MFCKLSWFDNGFAIKSKYYRTCLCLVLTCISSLKMSIFGLCFILYFLKLSAGYGFWSKLRNTDPNLHKLAIGYQSCLRRKQKAELDLSYLYKCKELNVYPKFVKWKNIARMKKKAQDRYHRLLLNDTIKEKRSNTSNLSNKSSELRKELCDRTTWMISQLILFSINRLLNREKTSILKRHRKKLDQLVSVKKTIDRLETNPNETILNLSGEELSEEQIDILKMGLRHGLATHPNKLDMMSISEDLWDQLDRLNQFKDGYFVKEKVKNSLRSFTYNYIDLDLKQFYVDRKRIRILRNMNINFAILKPDKGNGIVILIQ